MDGTRDLNVDHHSTRLLASGHAPFTVPMDNSATGHPNSQQLRPPYGDLVRPPGSPSDASSLSAYHSRYLASLPLTTGSSFPFLNSMFTSTLPAPPTTPFRAPPSSGVNSMRQFWPPTPPPDGYGRYGMNTGLFPLFGSVSPSPDNGTYITQGLVSRLGTPGHYSHLLDSHKEHSFFSPGIGLGSPLTPTSHVTPPTHFPHLIPSLERHPGFSHMTLGGKELDDGHLANESDDMRLMKGHMDCLVKPDIPSRHSSGERVKSKSEKHSEKSTSDLHRTPPPLWTAKEKQEEVKSVRKSESKPQQQLLNKVPPCKVEVCCSPTGKLDLLAPTSKVVKPEVSSSPVLVNKKPAASPVPVPVVSSPVSSVSPVTSYVDKSEARCCQCAASLKGVGVATKLGGCATETKSTPEIPPAVFKPVPPEKDNPVHQNNNKNNLNVTSPISTTVSVPTPTDSVVTNLSNSVEVVRLENSVSHHNSPENSSFPHSFEQTQKNMSYHPLNRTTKSDVHTTQSHTSVTCKHVTAAVIPTAPKQSVQREIHPEPIHNNAQCSNESEKSAKHAIPEICSVKPEATNQPLNASFSVKAESAASVTTIDNNENHTTESVHSHNTSKPVGKSLITCYKVKDMLKTGTSLHPTVSIENASNVSTNQNVDSVVSAKVSTVDATSKTLSLPCSPVIGTTCSSALPKTPCKSIRMQPNNVEVNKSYSPLIENNSSPLKLENTASSSECDFLPKPCATGWTKATVLPFNWQKNMGNADEQQAINLTVAKKSVKLDSPEPTSIVPCIRNPSPTLQKPVSCSSQPLKAPVSDSVMNSSTGVIGVCHPNTNTLISSTKSKVIAVTSSTSTVTNVSSTLAPSHSETTTTATTELFVTHRSTKSVIPVAVRNSTPPVLPKNSLPQVAATVNIHSKTLKSERLTSKRGKLMDSDKGSHGGRGTLATLAPKLSKNITFAKDGSTSHTLATSSSVSSTSIVFPATVNPCIPVGIAIAQQRQDSSATASLGKPQSSVSSAAPVTMTSTAHLTTTRVSQEIQPQLELVRDQKSQEITCSANPGSADSTNLLVTQGPTIVSRQWESEAVTRTALPSPWITHGSIVAPAVWLGQGTYATTTGPTSATVPSVPMSSLETSPISLPPGGYQLARDSITGHLFLIPSANIEIVDRSAAVWPSFSTAPTSTLPIQQLVTQQQHTQFEQVLPQVSEQDHVQDCLSVSMQQQTQLGESVKVLDATDSNCSIACNTSISTAGYKNVDQHEKPEEKAEENNQVSAVPLASGQTYAFTTFPTHCDPSSFSYVLQSSTVMHLAHTQTTASIQTESGKRSQGTSPLHSATPSPPPQSASEQAVQVSVTEDGLDDPEEESDDNDSDGVACGESTQVKLSCQTQSITTAIQVDMDSQTVSEDDDEEKKVEEVVEERKVEMSDSANQTESLISESPKSEPDENLIEDNDTAVKEEPRELKAVEPVIKHEEDKSLQTEPPLEIVTVETELAPSLPVESKPVMDFIDHHGLNLLVDSIEEFASREQEALSKQNMEPKSPEKKPAEIKNEKVSVLTVASDSQKLELKCSENSISEKQTLNSSKCGTSFSTSYKSIDTSCTDGLGLLCALAEQRFFEEALNTEEPTENLQKTSAQDELYDCYSFAEETDLSTSLSYSSPFKDAGHFRSTPNREPPPSPSQPFSSPFHLGSSPEMMDPSELDMRIRLAELQRKYKEKQRELARLQPKKESSDNEKSPPKKGPGRPRKRKIFTLPRAKHKAVISVKTSTCFPSHPFKSSSPRLLTKKTILSKSFQKKKIKKINKSLLISGSFVKMKSKMNNLHTEKSGHLEIESSVGNTIGCETKQPLDANTSVKLKCASVSEPRCALPNGEPRTILKVPKVEMAYVESPKENAQQYSKSIDENVKLKPDKIRKPSISSAPPKLSSEQGKVPAIKISTQEKKTMPSMENSQQPTDFHNEKYISQKTAPISSSSVINSLSGSVLSNAKASPEKKTSYNSIPANDQKLSSDSDKTHELHTIKLMKRKSDSDSSLNDSSKRDCSPAKKMKPGLLNMSSVETKKGLETLGSSKESTGDSSSGSEGGSKTDKSIIDGNTKDNLKTKIPFFDEQAWFVRRSERIFLSDARVSTPGQQTCGHTSSTNSGKKQGTPQSSNTQKGDGMSKEKKESTNKMVVKSSESAKFSKIQKTPKDTDTGLKKIKNKTPKIKSKSEEVLLTPKKRHLSECSSSSSTSSSSEELCPSSSSDSDSSDSNSSQSENLPLSILVEQAGIKAVSWEPLKRSSVDSDSCDFSSGQSEDIPLSVLLGHNSVKASELKSCIFTPADLQDKTRVLILDEGLFYAGYITAIQAPDVYGIILDGERAHRPHIFSREEILNAAVLEVKPTATVQLPEGSRICAYWSQQYRCLYPGTVTKASSPLPDPSLLIVEFDDGDSGRIPLEDIRMLPPDFPIVSMEPNPLMILGKRRARSDRESANEQRNISSSFRNDKDKIDYKKHKSSTKISKKKFESPEKKVPKESSKINIKTSSSSHLNASDVIKSTSLSSQNDAKCPTFKKKDGSIERKIQKKNKLGVKIKSKDLEKKKSSSVSSISVFNSDSSATPCKPKKHKKRKDEHKHHHHHHRHHHHHHKKHKSEKLNHSGKQSSCKRGENTQMSLKTMGSATSTKKESDFSVPLMISNHCTSEKSGSSESKKSELTVKIKTSPSPHTSYNQEEVAESKEKTRKHRDSSSDESDSESSDEDINIEKEVKPVKKKNKITTQKPAKRKDRPPSVEKSKIAAFLPVRQLWRWSGKSFRRPGAKGKAKKEYYRAIQRGKESIKVGDCAVFLSTGRPHLPYIGRIETMWESWGGKMVVKVKWFYHPEETKSGKKLSQLKGALFQSPHFDENDVQTISHKCEVLSWEEYQRKKDQDNQGSSSYSSLFDNNDTYYLAGTYDPILGTLTMEPGVPGIPVPTSSDV